MPCARHDILILTMSGSMSLLLQMASNPLTTEDAAALAITIRKNRSLSKFKTPGPYTLHF